MSALALIDATGWLHRCFHAFPLLSRKDGTPTGALVGFCNKLFEQIQRAPLRDASHAAAVFDFGGPTFRHEMDLTYKANRMRPDGLTSRDTLRPQFALAKRAAEVFGLPALSVEGVEADDVIAAAARNFAELGPVSIFSSDKDLLQLVTSDIRVVDAFGGGTYDIATVIKRWGVPPRYIADLLAIVGDASDNVRGVPGLGPTKAAKIINRYGGVHDGIDRAIANGELPHDLTHQLLAKHIEVVRHAYRLVVLDRPVDVDINALAVSEIDVERITDFLSEMEMVKLRSEVLAKWGVAA